jgi:hypothetical protein
MELNDKVFDDWTTLEKQTVRKACALWNAAAQIAIEGSLPQPMFEELQLTAIRQYEVARAFIDEVRTKENRLMWRYFVQLGESARKMASKQGAPTAAASDDAM